MRRWICPKCSSGKLAPARPRRDDARRFCDPCSAVAGHPVERVCPSLATDAAARKAARQDSAAAKRERLTVGGAYLPDFVRPYWRVLCDEARKAAPPGTYIPAHDVPPSLVVTGSSRPGYRSGLGSRRRVHLRLGAGVDKATGLELLLHELAHGACASLNRAEGAHGPTFRKTLRNAAARLWGVEVSIPLHRYALDDLIVVELRQKWGLPPGPTPYLDRARSRRAAKHTAPTVSPAEAAAVSAGS